MEEMNEKEDSNAGDDEVFYLSYGLDIRVSSYSECLVNGVKFLYCILLDCNIIKSSTCIIPCQALMEHFWMVMMEIVKRMIGENI